MSAAPIIVLGAQGQLGKDLVYQAGLQGLPVKGFSRAEADLSKMDDVLALLGTLQPSAVINAAAFTQVDLAEKEQETAFKINAIAPGKLAKWCAARNIPFVHYSTDYVFSGAGIRPWAETDLTGPLNIYGKSKLEGEDAIQKEGGKFLIFRTSWVYSPEGKNFLNTMLRLGVDKEEIRVVSDQHGAPTLARHLAIATLQVLEKSEAADGGFPSGIYHMANLGETTWHHFAEAIFEEGRKHCLDIQVKRVVPILTADYPTPAQRPLNSRLSTLKLFDTFGVELPEWRAALSECMELRQ